MILIERKDTVPAERKKQAAIEEAWLLYLNNVLFERGLISETEKHQMEVRINLRTAEKSA